MKDLIQKIDALYEPFKTDAIKCSKGNKVAGMRSRKVSLEIEKLLKAFRKESIRAFKGEE